MEMIFWDSPCGMYIPTEMIFSDYCVGCTYLRKWLGFDASPDRTWPQPGSQEGLSPTISGSCGKDPPIAHTHLATVTNAVTERGFKLFVLELWIWEILVLKFVSPVACTYGELLCDEVRAWFIYWSSSLWVAVGVSDGLFLPIYPPRSMRVVLCFDN